MSPRATLPRPAGFEKTPAGSLSKEGRLGLHAAALREPRLSAPSRRQCHFLQRPRKVTQKALVPKLLRPVSHRHTYAHVHTCMHACTHTCARAHTRMHTQAAHTDLVPAFSPASLSLRHGGHQSPPLGGAEDCSGCTPGERPLPRSATLGSQTRAARGALGRHARVSAQRTVTQLKGLKEKSHRHVCSPQRQRRREGGKKAPDGGCAVPPLRRAALAHTLCR